MDHHHRPHGHPMNPHMQPHPMQGHPHPHQFFSPSPFSDHPLNMLPFEAPTIFEQLPRFLFKMPKVHQDQKAKFEGDELFRRLSRETEIRYTGYRDRPLQERQLRFQNACREGHSDISFVSTGTNFNLVFNPISNGYNEPGCDFDKEHGKVYIKAPFIMNGICVHFRGWIDIERLDGIGSVEYDEERGSIEEAILKDQIDRHKAYVREMEQRERMIERQTQSDLELSVS